MLYIIDHWTNITVGLTAVASAIVHLYQIIVNAGGLKVILSNFINGKKT